MDPRHIDSGQHSFTTLGFAQQHAGFLNAGRHDTSIEAQTIDWGKFTGFEETGNNVRMKNSLLLPLPSNDRGQSATLSTSAPP